MKLEIFLFLVWLSLINADAAKNVDTDEVIVLRNGGRNNAFGHSVALTGSQVYVGAPQDSTHGNVFSCPINPIKQSPNCRKVNGKLITFWHHITFEVEIIPF